MTPEEVLNSDYVMLSSILRERSYTNIQRNNKFDESDENDENRNKTDKKEYVNVVDFETGALKRVEKVKSF